MLSDVINVPIKSTLCVSIRVSTVERIKDLGRLGFTSRLFRFMISWQGHPSQHMNTTESRAVVTRRFERLFFSAPGMRSIPLNNSVSFYLSILLGI